MQKSDKQRKNKLSRKSLEHRFDYLMKNVLEEFESCLGDGSGYDKGIAIIDDDPYLVDKARGP